MYSRFAQHGWTFLKIINTFHGVDNLTHSYQHLQYPKSDKKQPETRKQDGS